MYFLTVVEVGKSKMTVLANLPPDGDPLPLQTAASVAGSWPGHSSKLVHRHTQRSPSPPNATSASWIKTSVLLPHLILCSVTQLCLTLCDLMDCNPPGSSVRGILQARMGCHSLPQGPILPTQESNTSLLHCRQILYHLS